MRRYHGLLRAEHRALSLRQGRERCSVALQVPAADSLGNCQHRGGLQSSRCAPTSFLPMRVTHPSRISLLQTYALRSDSSVIPVNVDEHTSVQNFHDKGQLMKACMIQVQSRIMGDGRWCDAGTPEDSMHLTPKLLAGIYSCNITSWQDPAIAALNPTLT